MNPAFFHRNMMWRKKHTAPKPWRIRNCTDTCFVFEHDPCCHFCYSAIRAEDSTNVVVDELFYSETEKYQLFSVELVSFIPIQSEGYCFVGVYVKELDGERAGWATLDHPNLKLLLKASENNYQLISMCLTLELTFTRDCSSKLIERLNRKLDEMWVYHSMFS